MSTIQKRSLIKMMVVHEKTIKKIKREFLDNEVNDPTNLELCLQKMYYEIEPVYKEIMNRYSKPEAKTFQSKINTDRKYSTELEFPFVLPLSQEL